MVAGMDPAKSPLLFLPELEAMLAEDYAGLIKREKGRLSLDPRQVNKRGESYRNQNLQDEVLRQQEDERHERVNERVNRHSALHVTQCLPREECDDTSAPSARRESMDREGGPRQYKPSCDGRRAVSPPPSAWHWWCRHHDL